jgi:hypothetical protein
MMYIVGLKGGLSAIAPRDIGRSEQGYPTVRHSWGRTRDDTGCPFMIFFNSRTCSDVIRLDCWPQLDQ